MSKVPADDAASPEESPEESPDERSGESFDKTFARDVVARLREAGHEALWAGGCVRVLLLGLVPKDYDVATSAKPKEVARLFRRAKMVGAAFGVVMVLGPDRAQVEVATFRSDGDYLDGRRPSSVVFSSPEEDAARRDFTINGLFLDPFSGEIVDYVGGRADLEAGVVRAIGDPAKRLDEDKLRSLRAVRFAARFGFALDPATALAVRRSAEANELVAVSAERVLDELTKMLVPATRAEAFRLLAELRLAPLVFAELAGHWDQPEKVERIRRLLAFWAEPVRLPLALAGVLCVEPDGERAAELADAMLIRLRGANVDRDQCRRLCQVRDVTFRDESPTVARLKRLLAEPVADDWLRLCDARDSAENRPVGETARPARELLARSSKEEIAPPPILTGSHLIEWGHRPGPRFKPVLDFVYDEQLEGRVASLDDARAIVRRRLDSAEEA